MKNIEYYNKNNWDKSTLLKNAKEKNGEYNIFVTLLDELKHTESNSPLNNVPYTLKDNFSTNNILSTASSNSLLDYNPVYDSTVYKKLTDAGCVLVGKTVLDELAMGGKGITANSGVVKNSLNKSLISGGSSAGSAVSVSLSLVPFSIGSDTGDSIRKPAAYNAIVGYKPTYGLISRYGLFPFASSLDHVGVLTNNVLDAAKVVNEIKGKDEKDMTSINSSDIDLVSEIEKESKNNKLFYIKELVDINNYNNPSKYLKDMLEEFNKKIHLLKQQGYVIKEESIDINILNAIPACYSVIAFAEATSNYSNLNGIVFGPREKGNTYEDIMKNARSKGFCSLIKRRFVIGSYALDKENQEKYFLNAKRVRNLIVTKMDSYFEKYDALIMPVGNGYIEKIDEDYKIENDLEKALDDNLVIGNFGGYPSITIPVSFVNDFPFAVNLTSKRKDDKNLLNLTYNIEKLMDFKRGEE